MKRLITSLAGLAAIVGFLSLPTPAGAEVCNVKVVTDANPDYSDIGSMLYSITSNWKEDKDKVWAIWYWNHIARRQTSPMMLHGMELTDPIRQFNDYGYTMCSTIAGNNCAIFSALGYNIRFWDICNHTVMDVEYDGRYHMVDSSLSVMYTLCDGKTIADVTEIGQEGACEKSGGKVERGHIAKYHCLNATSDNGSVTGADDNRSLEQMGDDFLPAGGKYRYYYNNWDHGHRYSLNLRDNETYTRYYHRLDAKSPDAVPQPKDSKDYRADPAFYVPNTNLDTGATFDPESVNPRYRIRGNGVRIYAPALSEAELLKHAWEMIEVKSAGGIVIPAAVGEPGSVTFRVEGANVIASLKITADLTRKAEGDLATIAISTNNGLSWKDVFVPDKTGDLKADVKLIAEVNGSYEVLVKVSLMGKGAPADAALKAIKFETTTQVNSKTQPRLKFGKNTVYVGAGEPARPIVFWPDLRAANYKAWVTEEKNVKAAEKHPEYLAVMCAEKPSEDAYVVYKLQAPTDITHFTYGGRFRARFPKSHVDMLHSLDGGKTWTKSYSLTDNTPPWDVIHYETIRDVPPNTRSVLVKYLWNGGSTADDCGLFAVRMEANCKSADPAFKPMEVAFTWKEVQKDFTTIERSHVQKVDKVPFTYEINVGGEDHPVMESLRVNVVGAQPATAPAKYGYSDGKDIGGAKFADRWVTVGKILSTGKPYTATEKSLTNWEAGDPDGKKLTDGVVGSTYNGGIGYRYGVVYDTKMKPEITVDLGDKLKCGAFRIQVGGWEPWDALKGQIKDKVEVLTSADGKEFASQGFFNFDLRWKDIPANFAWPDEETMVGYNAALVLDKPVEARYVKYKITVARLLAITEVQVLDGITYAPFDLKIALPDGKDRSDISMYPLRHDTAAEYKRMQKLMGPEGGKVVGEIK